MRKLTIVFIVSCTISGYFVGRLIGMWLLPPKPTPPAVQPLQVIVLDPGGAKLTVTSTVSK